MPHFKVKVSYNRKNATTLTVRASDTVSAQQKAKDIVEKWGDTINVKVEDCKLDG